MELTRIQLKNIIRFLLFLGIMFLLLNVITPYFYRLLPNDYVRTRLILNTLESPEKKPDLVILGNSRGMSGVNGYKLEKELKGNPCVYSFTSTGQRLSESALYYTSLPSSVQVVVQCVDLDQLRNPIDLDVPNKVALHMYGYRMDDFTRRLLPGLEKSLSRSDFYYNYEARNSLFTGLTTYLRNKLDNDVIPGAVEFDLRYPNSTTSDRNESTYQRNIEEQNENNKFEAYEITSEWKKLIETSSVYFKNRNIVYYLVIMPYNPDITIFTTAEKQRALSIFIETFGSFSIIDCMDLLDASDFYDAIHPNRKGAEKITNHIIKTLQSSNICF